MVDKFFVQYRQWLTIFLCNGVMLLLLLLNIVNIVVLKNNGLYIFSFNDNTDNGRQFFVQWSNDAFIIVDYCR